MIASHRHNFRHPPATQYITMSTSRTETHMFGRFPYIVLQDNYFQEHETVCVICYNDTTADFELQDATPATPDPENNIRAISPTSTIQLGVCQHVFHERCLVKWLQDQTSRFLHGNCPMCRRMLIFNPTLRPQTADRLPRIGSVESVRIMMENRARFIAGIQARIQRDEGMNELQ